MTKLEIALDSFLNSLNEQRFYDAHEDLEELWFPKRFEDDDEIRLLKGFINAAVSFELIKRGRPNPSKKAWANYLKYKTLLNTINSPYKQKYKDISLHVEQIHSDLAIIPPKL
jgi:hypothetical protein